MMYYLINATWGVVMNNTFEAQNTMFIMSQLLTLLVLMGIAGSVNKYKKRKVMNGALFYLVVGLLFLAMRITTIFLSKAVDPSLKMNLAGQILGGMIWPLGIAVYLHLKFRKAKSAELSQAETPTKEQA